MMKVAGCRAEVSPLIIWHGLPQPRSNNAEAAAMRAACGASGSFITSARTLIASDSVGLGRFGQVAQRLGSAARIARRTRSPAPIGEPRHLIRRDLRQAVHGSNLAQLVAIW